MQYDGTLPPHCNLPKAIMGACARPAYQHQRVQCARSKPRRGQGEEGAHEHKGGTPGGWVVPNVPIFGPQFGQVTLLRKAPMWQARRSAATQ